ncbi:MAG: protein BatD [Ectothiorhodospiraceae bacterium]|nr:protein BatD [Ectothiorhodospiraceae bacterium]
MVIFNKIVTAVSLTLLTLLLPLVALAANVTLKVDRNPVTVNESFTLIFETDDSVNGSPDFRPLDKDFEILSRSQSSQMQFINGAITRQTRWTLTAMAKRSGIFTIPSVRIGDDDSPAASITVNKPVDASTNSESKTAAANNEIFIEAKATPIKAYVQQQIILTIRFYRAVNINGANMTEPVLEGGEVVVEKLGDDLRFETRHNNQRYMVIERKYALYPQQSGTITIEPIQLDAQIAIATPGRFDPFGRNSKTTRLITESITLNVQPVPVKLRNSAWLPSSEVTLTERWTQQPDTFVVGEPITRTLTLSAKGLTAAQLPPLVMTDTEGFKAYPDQPILKDKRGRQGINGSRQEKIALIPTRAGSLSLPAITVSWWNTRTNKQESATLPARTVQVRPGENTAQTAQIPQPAGAPYSITGSETEAVSAAISRTENEAISFYSTLSILLGVGWLLTVTAWVISRRRHSRRQSGNKNSLAQKAGVSGPMGHHRGNTSLTAVKKACLNNDSPLSKTELLKWANAYWHEQPPTSLADIGHRLDEVTQQEIAKLNQALYGITQKEWLGSGLWQSLSAAVKSAHNNPPKRNEALASLYP